MPTVSRDASLLKNFTLNGDIYCGLTFGWHKIPAPECDCEWELTRDADHYGHWTCKKCSGKFGVDVWD